MIFTSDNAVGAAPEVLAAIAEANGGALPSYGADAAASAVEAKLSDLFECDLAMFLVLTGTAANALAVAALCPPWGVVFCHDEAHIQADECGAPVFFAGGAELSLIPGPEGKLQPETLAERIRRTGALGVHQTQPAMVSITNATETGHIYSVAELRALGETAHAHRLKLHMDGARFANAVAASGAAPADLTWRAGVDALSFGGTKNGCLAVEALIFFNPDQATRDRAMFMRKRTGHLLSKGRFFSAQMSAYLENDNWLTWAAHANAMRARLAEGLAALPGVELVENGAANMLFVRLPRQMDAALKAAGARYYPDPPWEGPEGDGETVGARLVTSCLTQAAEVDAFLAAAGGAG